MNNKNINCILLKSLESFGKITFTARGILQPSRHTNACQEQIMYKRRSKLIRNTSISKSQPRIKPLTKHMHPITIHTPYKIRPPSYSISECMSKTKIKRVPSMECMTRSHNLSSIGYKRRETDRISMSHNNSSFMCNSYNLRYMCANGTRCNQNYVCKSVRSRRSLLPKMHRKVDIIIPIFHNISSNDIIS